jgi:hypothetical protein
MQGKRAKSEKECWYGNAPNLAEPRLEVKVVIVVFISVH